MTAFRVSQNCYYGPLDLLVYLVRKQEVDVRQVEIANLAAAFLDYLTILTAIDMDEVGEFLVFASTLMEFKSRLLLPVNENRLDSPAEAEDREKLVRQLLEYKRFKEAGALLEQRRQSQRRKLGRRPEDATEEPLDPSRQPIRELELWDLVTAFSRIFKENLVPVQERIPIDRTPITVYQQRLEASVLEGNGLRFRQLVGGRKTRSQVIGMFLALLELIKQRRVWIEVETDDVVVYPPRRDTPQPLAPSLARLADGEVTPPAPDTESAVLEEPSERNALANPEPPAPSAPGFMEAPTPPLVHASSAYTWNGQHNAPNPAAWQDFEPILDNE